MKRDKAEMVEGSSQGTTAGMVEQLRAECERNRDKLRELARIHLSVDEPTRSIGVDEPDWISRLRKICLHVRAIDSLEIGIDISHVMAPELRAAYVQMDAVWKCMPREFKIDEMNSDWWANEARSGMLATYDHPTPLGLALLRVGRGNLRSGKAWESYTHLAIWLGFLGLGYGSALAYLAEVLGVGREVASHLEATMMQGLDEQVAIGPMLSILARDEQMGDS